MGTYVTLEIHCIVYLLTSSFCPYKHSTLRVLIMIKSFLLYQMYESSNRQNGSCHSSIFLHHQQIQSSDHNKFVKMQLLRSKT